TGGGRSSSGDGGRRHAELLFERLDALGQLEHGDALELVDPVLGGSHVRCSPVCDSGGSSGLRRYADAPDSSADASASALFSTSPSEAASSWASATAGASSTGAAAAGASPDGISPDSFFSCTPARAMARPPMSALSPRASPVS